jgi:hypothetical protein
MRVLGDTFPVPPGSSPFRHAVTLQRLGWNTDVASSVGATAPDPVSLHASNGNTDGEVDAVLVLLRTPQIKVDTLPPGSLETLYARAERSIDSQSDRLIRSASPLIR